MVGWMTKKIHNYHFGQWPEMPWKENKMNTREKKTDDYASWCALILNIALEEVYEKEKAITGILHQLSYPLEEIQEESKEEWIENKLQEWQKEAKKIYGANFLKEDNK